MIQVDVDGHVLGANKPAALAVMADAKLFLAALAGRLESMRDAMKLDARRRRLANYGEAMRTERAKHDERLRTRRCR